jgi:ribosome-associated protein
MQIDQIKNLVIEAMEDLKAVDIRVLDVSELSSIADYMVIASGTSKRHVNSIAENVKKIIKENGLVPLGSEGEDGSEWVLVDLGDIIVNVMTPDTRAFYDLEKLWQPIPEPEVDRSVT